MRGKSWISTIVLIVVCLSIWKTNNGDFGRIADSIWTILNKGADIVTSLWNKVLAINTSSTPSPSPTPTAMLAPLLTFFGL